MGTRGRKSTASLSLAPVVGLTPPPPVPADALPEYAKEVWRDAVASLPSGHLKPADLPLLEVYCVSADVARQAREWLAREYEPEAHAVLSRALTDMARAARALRLCPSTRTRPDSAALQKPAGALPWEFDPEQ